MTTPRTCALVLGALAVVAAGPAHADLADDVAGRYEVKYEEVTSNCTNTGMSMLRSVLDIKKKSSQSVTVDIDRIPLMSGAASKGKRVKATSKLGPTSIQGLDGRFSVAGRLQANDVLELVLVAEYYLNKKPYCTQSWNVSGTRAGGGGGGDDAPKKKASIDGLELFGITF